MPLGDLSSGLYLGRPLGIAVRVHASWLLIFVLLLLSLAMQVLPLMDLAGGGPWWDGVGLERSILDFERQYSAVHKELPSREVVDTAFQIKRWPPWQYWALGALGSLGLFLCVLAHELGHSVVARASGMQVEGITLFVFGGVSRLSDEPPSARVEFKVAIVGPLISLVLGGACLGAYYGLGPSAPGQGLALLFYFGFINLMLGAFNLVPGFPLDGGRVLRSILWSAYGNLHRATAVASRWGRIFGAVLIAIGVIQFFLPNSAMAALWMIFIGLFLRYAAGAAYQQMAVREALSGLTVRGLLKAEVVTVAPDLALERLVDDYFYKYRFRSFPVLDGDTLAGMVSLKDVQAVPRARWATTTVGQAMHQVREENLIHPDDDLVSVFRKMTEADKGHLPVIENGRLTGIVTRHDIMDLLHVRLELGEGGPPSPAGGDDD